MDRETQRLSDNARSAIAAARAAQAELERLEHHYREMWCAANRDRAEKNKALLAFAEHMFWSSASTGAREPGIMEPSALSARETQRLLAEARAAVERLRQSAKRVVELEHQVEEATIVLTRAEIARGDAIRILTAHLIPGAFDPEIRRAEPDINDRALRP